MNTEPTIVMDHCDLILNKMPYNRPFLFVDAFTEITDTGAKGYYTFREDEYFYQGHFPENPVTPGVIMTETMAQIGLVGLGMYLTKSYITGIKKKFAFVSSDVQFKKAVLPGEKVFVESEKIYFRFGKLKCKVSMKNENDEVVCKGILSGVTFD